MSAFNEIQTEFTDGDNLIDALKAMGYNPTNCIGDPRAGARLVERVDQRA